MTAPSALTRELTTNFSSVVVPVDFSASSWRAWIQAGRMARAFGVPRTVLHVDTSSPWIDEGAQELVLRRSPSGVPVDVTVVAARSPADGILRFLNADEKPLLVMSTHGHTAAAELATGSTAESVLRRWDGPMLLAGPNFKVSPVPFRRVVLCIDPDATVTSPLLADDVGAWAGVFNLPVEVLAVVEPAPLSDFEEILQQNARLEAYAGAVSGDDRVARLVRLEGKRPGQDIARYADAVDGTLLAIPTHARTPSARFVLGSTAISVLRHVTSPVLVRRFPTR